MGTVPIEEWNGNQTLPYRVQIVTSEVGTVIRNNAVDIPRQISHREAMDVFIAWVVLSFGFSIMFARVYTASYPLILVGSFVTAGTGFVIHEMAHKFTAIHYGYWAEFVKDTRMLILSVVTAIFGFMIAAPGATQIYGMAMARDTLGRIAAAGPVSNIILALPFALLALIMPGFLIWKMGFQINAMLALFNMIPVFVLDGKKVWDWDHTAFGVIAGIAGLLFLASMVM